MGQLAFDRTGARVDSFSNENAAGPSPERSFHPFQTRAGATVMVFSLMQRAAKWTGGKRYRPPPMIS
jgi:hypothetical protein